MRRSVLRRVVRLRRWWWWLWTGESSLHKVRRKLDSEVRRFGGRVTWDD
jgi:hypothetical protein